MASEERKEVKEQASTGTDLIVLAGEKRNLEHRKMFLVLVAQEGATLAVVQLLKLARSRW